MQGSLQGASSSLLLQMGVLRVRIPEGAAPNPCQSSQEELTLPTSNTPTTQTWIRFAGALGAAIFLLGDLLVFGHLGSGAEFREGAIRAAQSASVGQLYFGGALGPIGACFLLVGVWFISSRLNSPRSALASVTTLLLVAFVITASSVHALWATNALLVKFCFGQAPACVSALQSVQAYWRVVFLLSAAIGVVAFVLLAWQVVAKRTTFPRWSVLASPLLLFVIAQAGPVLPSPFGAVVVAGSASISLLIFFLVAAFSATSASAT